MLNNLDLQEIQDFVKAIAKSGATEVSIELNDVKLTVKVPPRGKAAKQTETTYIQQIPIAPQMGAPMHTMHLPQAAANPAAPVAVSSAETKDSTEGNYITIKSPMVGTFYRKAGPDKPSYVNVGDEISVGETVCMIEAMKLFNEIESEVSGRIVKILVDDSKPVEFDQALFLVDPS
jgi:acetyl-CoA carboxylase biotin carboxyl carrier protein